MPSSNTVGHNSSSKKAMIEFATDSYSSLILDIIYEHTKTRNMVRTYFRFIRHNK